MQDKEAIQRFSNLGAVPFVQGMDKFSAFFKEDVESVDKFIKSFPGGLK